MEGSKKLTLPTSRKDGSYEEREFLKQCAIAAMQGIQEMGGIAGEALEIAPCTIIARKAFDIAEAMVEELRKRTKTE